MIINDHTRSLEIRQARSVNNNGRESELCDACPRQQTPVVRLLGIARYWPCVAPHPALMLRAKNNAQRPAPRVVCSPRREGL
jgi:hypothetical protein